MTIFIDKLTEKEEKQILEKLGFISAEDRDKTGYSVSKFAGYKVFKKIKSQDPFNGKSDEEILYISDFDARINLNKSVDFRAFYDFMFDKFGYAWCEKGLSLLKGKKSIDKVRCFNELIEKGQTDVIKE